MEEYVAVGTAMILTSLLFLYANLIMLRRILSDKELVKLNAYRLVILLVAADVVQLLMHILSGIYMLCQSSFEPVSDQVTGAIITAAYVFYTLISLLLAFNRLVQLTSRRSYERLFGNVGMMVQCGICAVVALLFLAILSSPLACIHYDVALWTWIYDKGFWWSSEVERIEMYIELFCYTAGGVMYFASFVAIIYKRSVYAAVRHKGPERRFLFQAAGITVFMLLFNFFWHEYDLIFPGSKYGLMAVNFIWILSCAMNAIAFYYVHGVSTEHCRWSIAFLGSTGLLYESASGGRKLKRYARRILSVSLLLLVFAQTTYGLIAKLLTGEDFLSALLEWLTTIRPLVSMMFFVYWQISGKLQLLLRELRGHIIVEYMKSASACDRWTSAFFAVAVNARNVLFYLILVLLTLTVSDQAGGYLRLRGLVYGSGVGFIIPVAIQTYANYAANAILCFQVVITLCMRSAFEQFNLRLKRIKYATFDEAAKTLRGAMNHHITLLETLDVVDDVFSVHTLVRLLLALLRALFAGVVLAGLILGEVHCCSVILSVAFDILDCLIEIIALTLVPMSVSAKIMKAEKLLCQNPALWARYDEEVYQTATAFILQLRRPGIGLSLGGLMTLKAPRTRR